MQVTETEIQELKEIIHICRSDYTQNIYDEIDRWCIRIKANTPRDWQHCSEHNINFCKINNCPCDCWKPK